MPSKKIDFTGLNSKLLAAVEHHLRLWLPNGELKGHEYQVGSVGGERGGSLKINTRTGKWADFAGGASGGDLVSLYAAIKNLSQVDAANELEGHVPKTMTPAPKKIPNAPFKIIKPPRKTELPACRHMQFGDPSARYIYKDEHGDTLFIVARYDHKNGKDCIPFCYTDQKRWVRKMWPGKRPLYGLSERVQEAKAILVVEGEKAVIAARKIVGTGGAYAVVSWSGGSNAYNKTDWTPLYGKKILIWPDADEAGKHAGEQIAHMLKDHTEEIKLIDLGSKNGGWDAADALDDGMGWREFVEWAKPKAVLITDEHIPIQDVERVVHEIPQPSISVEEAPIDVPDEVKILWYNAGLACSRTSGVPIISAENVLRLLHYTKHLNGRLWYDEFYADMLTQDQDGNDKPWSDADMVDLLVTIQGRYGLHRLTLQVLEMAVRQYAYKHIRNTVKDWLGGLKWDGVARIQQFFHTHLGARDDEYTRSASQNWWLSMAARIQSPGCQVDNMVILEGIQGVRKSSLLREIAQKWYVEASSAFGTKDFYQQIQGALIVEIAELDMFSKSDVNTIKRVVSNTVDTFRPPYARRAAEFPRQCVFVGTTNQDGYLMDDTGNRRYWPVAVTNIDIDAVRRDREQLFAEAVALYKQGHNWWQMPEEFTKEVQSGRLAEDPWLDRIESYISDIEIRMTGVTCTDIATDCLQIEIGRVSRRETIRIGKCLRALGWDKRVIREGAKLRKRFMPPDYERLALPEPEPQREIINHAPGMRPNGV